MRVVLVFFLFFKILFAEIDFSNITSKFEQKIVNDEGKEIVYTGELFIKNSQVLWQYKTPIEKTVLIRDRKVVITEPELYQVTILSQDQGINIKKIYENSKVVSQGVRETTYDGVVMRIQENDNFIREVTFKDKLDNLVSISFFQAKFNRLEADKFSIIFPEDYDVVYR